MPLTAAFIGHSAVVMSAVFGLFERPQTIQALNVKFLPVKNSL